MRLIAALLWANIFIVGAYAITQHDPAPLQVLLKKFEKGLDYHR